MGHGRSLTRLDGSAGLPVNPRHRSASSQPNIQHQNTQQPSVQARSNDSEEKRGDVDGNADDVIMGD